MGSTNTEGGEGGESVRSYVDQMRKLTKNVNKLNNKIHSRDAKTVRVPTSRPVHRTEAVRAKKAP